eukprot:Sspe_Gene.47543::Locus_24298_Transcript_1_1_Confidence_1.000_Length_2121::g.47543::m.47543
MSTRFVAAMTKTWSRPSTPSISVRSWFTRRSAPGVDRSIPRFGASASSSSKKSTHGAEARPRANTILTARSLSPTYLLRSSGPLTDMKFAEASLAIAFATNVFPHPGGPKSSSPQGVPSPTLLYSPGNRMGRCTHMIISSLTPSKAPTSFHVTSGIVLNPSLMLLGWTRVTASAKSSLVTQTRDSRSRFSGMGTRVRMPSWSAEPSCVGRACRMAFRSRRMQMAAASLITACRSDPTNPGVQKAISVMSTSSAVRRLRISTSRISLRSPRDGMPSPTSRWKRPVRRRAGSITSGRLVAPRTITTFFCCLHSVASPSMHVWSWATMRASMAFPASSRFPAMASTSSMKIKLGAAAEASANRVRRRASESPLTPETISGPSRAKNGTETAWARAWARRVFPVPGGPKSRTPVGGSVPRSWKRSGWARGNPTNSLSCSSTFVIPPRSLKVAMGVVVVSGSSLRRERRRLLPSAPLSAPSPLPTLEVARRLGFGEGSREVAPSSPPVLGFDGARCC